MNGSVCINGDQFTLSEAKVSALDAGFLFGDGCFETLRTFRGRPFRLRPHLERLLRAAQTLHIQNAPSLDVLETWALRTLSTAALPEAVLRITLTRGVSFSPSGPTVVVTALPLPALDPKDVEGIVATVLWPRSAHQLPPPWVKSTSYQGAVLARHEVARKNAAEGLYVADGGIFTEGATSNLFFVLEGRLHTAPDSLCLPGITRAEVLSIAQELKVPVELTPIAQSHLPRVSECFISSSIAGLRPILAIDSQTIGNGKPGPVFSSILKAYNARTEAGDAE